MFRSYKSVGSRRVLPPVVWLQLMITVTFILVLAGCGSGGASGNSAQEDTGGSEPSTDKAKSPTVSESTRKDPTAQPEGTAKTTEQASGNDGNNGELGTPALGDPGAPVVMVEYSDYQ